MLRSFVTRLLGLFRNDVRIDEEIAGHLEMLAAEFESRDMSPREARLAARRAFGGVAQVREQWREQRGLPWVESLRQDLRYARGQMRRHPSFAVTTVLTLALGIGANTVVYQVLDGVVYRPLPVRAPRQLQLLHIVEDGKQTVGNTMSQDFSYPLFRDLAARQDMAESLIASGFGASATGGNGEKLSLALVSGNYFGGLGAPVALGRALTPADDRPGAPPVAVISHRFWEKHYGRRAEAVGQTLRIGRASVMVAGVAAAEFCGLTLGWEPDAWLPATLQPQVMATDFLGDRNNGWLNLIARLKPGVTPAHAQAALDALFRAQPDAAHRHLTLSPGYRGIAFMQDGVKLLALASMALVSVVLLIACCNLANLMLGRGAARTHEIGVRLALGAGRRRIVRQLFTEGLFLATAGAVGAVTLAAWAGPALIRCFLEPPPGAGFDWHSGLFALLAAVLATCLFALAPALAATRLDLLTALQANRRSYSGGRSTHRLGRTLIAAQISVSILLLYGAALLGRSLWNLEHRDAGFRTERLLIATFNSDMDQARSEMSQDAFAQPLYDRLNHLPGVMSAALCAFGPLSNATATDTLSTPERPSPAENDVLEVHVSAGYFETMSTPILRGRAIGNSDRAGTRRVTVLGETEARRLFSGADPIGRMVSGSTSYDDKEALEVVGVARDILFSGPRDTSVALYYVPLAQAPAPVTSVAVRTAGTPAAAAGAVRAALRKIAPARDISKIEPVAEIFDEAIGTDQLLAFSSGGFGLLALALTALGIYGVIGYAMAGRTREIGIRLGLGATRTNVARLIAGEYFWLVTASAAAGAIGAVAAGRVLRDMLFGVAANDYVMLLGAAAVLAGVASLAGWLPARRASRLDPLDALREE